MPLAAFDQRFLAKVPAVIGVDEAGRGPLAGPVCAAGVYLDRAFYQSKWFFEYANGVNDSKQLKEAVRERIFEAVESDGEGTIHYACHMATVEEIERLNILGATRLAMARCIDDLIAGTTCPFTRVFEGGEGLFQRGHDPGTAEVLVDGKALKPFPHAHTPIVKGDGKSLAVALASVIAKVTRDRHMREQAKLYPDYGFVSNKGYGTPKHIAALKTVGPCKLHRMGFLNQILAAQ